jgi:hypothetical protein
VQELNAVDATDFDPSRRSIVAGMATGLLAGVSNSALAQGAQQAPSPPEQLRNPVIEYPRPPYPLQN